MVATHRLLHSSETNEWYTPAPYVERARTVLGAIDLDPASCAEANAVVQATCFMDEAINGLSKDWWGRVFLNPPYGKTRGLSNQGTWTDKLTDEYLNGRVKAAVALLNAATDTGWFRRLWVYDLCFVQHRISFWQPGLKYKAPTHGSVFLYLGPARDRFATHFGQIGHIVRGRDWPYDR